MPVILALLAVLVAVSFLLLRDRHRGMGPIAVALPTRVAATPTEAATPAPAAAPTAVPEPSPPPTGAPAAAATPKPRPTPRRKPTSTPAEPPRAADAGAVAAPAPAPALERPANPDVVIATRRAVRFTSSPDQARLSVDGRPIGIADDWDNRGGGRELELPRGVHFVKMELPGYRPLVVEIQVTPESGKDSPSIDAEMDRFDRMAYDRLPAPADRTTGAVDFMLDPTDATVSESGKVLGAATNFGPATPMQIKTSPAVHDFVLSAPGYKSRLVRILVAANAGKDRASIRETLKRE
jgi:hypothetical protein